ncbi:formate dehydrogenase accessory sulfurtransferase FdhD [Grimontia sp. NTOU-MAR1]|uniref:formate dehydrogenase accessory sulfurtransferase FdhD n=1 Tax=Grimontia sp. NTOU-MAR1 TaxID=3111011 RepID=UPI002DBBE180|nr:formate dehydrogenase accessory sulfurtransferase FdhD [Grimontia sp. NTOU-MAR1]WRW00557.1 formate dehydrogenase accessory sulfurtransferase FdhD [Grimontia sp. NTOU-MAR1]
MTNRKIKDNDAHPDAPLPPHSLHHYIDDASQVTSFATLPTETPLAIGYNGVSHAVMMVTPQDIEDFIYGFSFTERIIRTGSEIHDINIQHRSDALIADVQLANRAQARLSLTKRHLAGRTGCGICGTESLDHAIPKLEPLPYVETLSNDSVLKLRESLRHWQSLGHISGAIHAAMLLDEKGDILLCREDIGRHNALDKTLGTALRSKALTPNLALLVTSRCSIELVQKAVLSGVGTLITLGTPTSLAVNTAIQANLNLVHLPRQDAPRFYNRASR